MGDKRIYRATKGVLRRQRGRGYADALKGDKNVSS